MSMIKETGEFKEWMGDKREIIYAWGWGGCASLSELLVCCREISAAHDADVEIDGDEKMVYIVRD